MDVGDRISHWRAVKGLSREDLAQAVGVSVAAVYQWEGSEKIERTNPSTTHLIKVAKAFGITLSDFWGELPRLSKAKPKARAQ